MPRRPVTIFIFCGLFVALALAVWWPIFSNQFLLWDDDFNLYENWNLQNGEWLSFWREPYMGFYIPLTYTIWSFVDFCFGMTTAVPYAALNLTFHVINSFLIFILILSLFKKLEIETKSGLGTKGAAGLGALLYLLHPIQVEAVAWHSGFRDLLSHFWTLLVLNIVLRRQSWSAFSLAFVAYALALLSKPSAASLPVLMALLAFMIPGMKKASSFIFLAFTLILGVGFSIWTSQIQSGYMVGMFPTEWWQKPFIVIDSYGFYLKQLFGGGVFVADAGHIPSLVMQKELWEISALWLCGFLLAVSFLLREHKRIFFAFLVLWIIPLLPTSGIVDFNYQRISTVADHYFIVALPAFCFLFAVLAARLSETINQKIVLGASFGLFALCSWGTYQNLKNWHDNNSFFQSVLKANPSSHSANNYLGLFAFRKKDYVTAEKYFRDADRSLPMSGISSANLAKTLVMTKRYQEAAQILKEKFDDPQFIPQNLVHQHIIAANYLGLGLALGNLGQYADAFRAVCKVAQYNPEPLVQRDTAAALLHLRKVLRPKDPNSLLCSP